MRRAAPTFMNNSGIRHRCNILRLAGRFESKSIKIWQNLAIQGNLDPRECMVVQRQLDKPQERSFPMQAKTRLHLQLGHGFAPGAKIECVEAVLREVTGV